MGTIHTDLIVKQETGMYDRKMLIPQNEKAKDLIQEYCSDLFRKHQQEIIYLDKDTGIDGLTGLREWIDANNLTVAEEV